MKPSSSSCELDIYDCKTIDKLDVTRTIGCGAQSEVYEVTREQKLALKVLFVSGIKTNTKDENKD